MIRQIVSPFESHHSKKTALYAIAPGCNFLLTFVSCVAVIGCHVFIPGCV